MVDKICSFCRTEYPFFRWTNRSFRIKVTVNVRLRIGVDTYPYREWEHNTSLCSINSKNLRNEHLLGGCMSVENHTKITIFSHSVYLTPTAEGVPRGIVYRHRDLKKLE